MMSGEDVRELEQLLSRLAACTGIGWDIVRGRGNVGLQDGKQGGTGIDDALSAAADTGGPVVLEHDENGNSWLVPVMCGADRAELFVIVRTAGTNNRFGDGLPQDVLLVRDICSLVAKGTNHERELESFTRELSSRYEELNFIFEIGRSIADIADQEKSLLVILENARELVETEAVCISIPAKNIFQIVDGGGTEGGISLAHQRIFKYASPMLIESFRGGNDYLTRRDLQGFTPINQCLSGKGDVLVLPVTLKGTVQGVVLFSHAGSGKEFTSSDKRLMNIATDIIAIRLTNAELFENLEAFLISVMKSFVKAIEEKDAYTRGHSERVNDYCLMMGESMGLDRENLKALTMAAILHDIGKIGVPETILNKPDRLTDEEYEKVKQHPRQGFEILKPIKQLEDVLPGILYHHERIDGRGYPLQLTGDEIPLIARIIAVADVFDAMTSTRAYRRAMTREDAILEVQRVRGSQLDEELVGVFLHDCLAHEKGFSVPTAEQSNATHGTMRGLGEKP